MKLGPNSKPHRGNAGYVCEMRAKLGGHIVIYDREKAGIDGGDRWVVMHEPSSLHVTIHSLKAARQTMQGVAHARTIAEANEHAQIIPQPGGNSAEADDDGAQDTVKTQKRLARKAASDEESNAALDRFMADHENEPSEDGKAALRKAFDL